MQSEADYYAIRSRASDFCFSIWKKDGPAYAVRFCTIRRDKTWFENPMAQVVRFCPKIQRLGPSDYQIEKWHRFLILRSKNLIEQRRPGTAAVRGTHKSTRGDRCAGLQIQPRCANAVAAPHRSQTTASCRSTRAQTYQNKETSAPSARLSWLGIMQQVYTQRKRRPLFHWVVCMWFLHLFKHFFTCSVHIFCDNI